MEAKWHLSKKEIDEVIRKLRAENPNVDPCSIYSAVLAAQDRKQEETETKFVRNQLGELLSVSYFDGLIISVERVSEIPPAFLEAFDNNQRGGKDARA